jgi:hypothetical protein
LLHYDVADWLHGSNRIDRGDFNRPVLSLLHNDIAG